MSTSPTSKLARNLRYAEVELYLEEKKKEREKERKALGVRRTNNTNTDGRE